MHEMHENDVPDGRGPGPYVRSALLAFIIYVILGSFYLCVANATLTSGSLEEQLLAAHGLVATTIFSVAGLMAAQNRAPTRLLHGVLVAFACAFLTANGGGTVRDSFGGQALFWVLAPAYVAIPVVATALSVVIRPVPSPELVGAIRISDNFATGVFLYAGIAKVVGILSLQHPYFMLVGVGVGMLTALGGGMIRDFCLLRRVPTVFVSTAFVNAFGLAVILAFAMKGVVWWGWTIPPYAWVGSGFAMLVLNEVLAGRTFSVPR